MDYLDSILLSGIERINGERSISGLYHLLNGKKSSQTVQDGRLFHLSHLFGTLRGYHLNDFHEKIVEFQRHGWIEMNNENHARITAEGAVSLEKQLQAHPVPSSIDGWHYGDLSSLFWRRLTLYVQTLSYILNGDHTFHPIQNDPDIQSWVKFHFPRDESSRASEAEALFEELSTLLESIEDRDADNIVQRLTRYQRIGKTNMQVAEDFQKDPIECHLHFQAALHFLIDSIMKQPDRYPVLKKFFSDKKQQHTLTESTRKTYQMIGKGLSLEEVAAIRRLKPSTIEDHIVELAIYVPEMDISPYVLGTDQKRVIKASNDSGTKRLKVVKEMLGDDLSYFQIRLTLAKYTDSIRSNKGVLSSVD